jgi:hypothetical protein
MNHDGKPPAQFLGQFSSKLSNPKMTKRNCNLHE